MKIIARYFTAYDEEFFAVGDTIEQALEGIEFNVTDVDPRKVEFYEARLIPTKMEIKVVPPPYVAE